MLYVLRKVPPDVPLCLVLANSCSIKVLMLSLPLWEDRGWISVPYAPILRALVNALRQRCAPTAFQKANTEAEWSFIDLGRNLARSNTPLCTPREVALHRNPAFDLSGVRLSVLSQKLATAGIKASTNTDQRKSTQLMVESVLAHSTLDPNNAWSEKKLWRSLCQKDIRPQVHTFLWKILHKAYRCGPFWKNIPSFEHCQYCSHCHVIDSMEHILTECKAKGQKDVWCLVR